MASPEGDIRLFSPEPRGIIPLESFHIPHGTKKTLADPAWEIRVDTCFPEVIAACAHREETWIDHTIFSSYCDLHLAGHAHSIEVWREGRLAGGLYGVRLQAAFFGESMFHRVPGASKVALVELVRILRQGGFRLLDIQWITPHLAHFGATAIPRQMYLGQLHNALQSTAEWLPDSQACAKARDVQKVGRCVP